MDFAKVVEQRRCIRLYTLDPIVDDLIARCLESARVTPSAGHHQSYPFFVVKYEEKKRMEMSTYDP